MGENINIAVSHLPSLTWWRLGVNSAQVEENAGAMTQTELRESEIPAGISAKQMSMQEAAAWTEGLAGEIQREKFIAGKTAIYQEQNFQTGLGREYENWIREAVQNARVFTVEAGKKVTEPVLLARELANASQSCDAQVIYAEEGSESTFVISSTSDAEAEALLCTQTKVYLEKGAVVHLVKVNMVGEEVVTLDDCGAVTEEGAHFDFVQMLLGGKKTYAGCVADQRGRHSVFTINTGYTAHKDHLMDLSYVAVQRGEKTESNFQVKGVLSDKAQKVFRGTIDFRNGSCGSVGDEQEDVLLMDPDVINKTVPVILCEEEDVDGRHGASIGRLSQDMLFYLENRGIPEKEAERMMVQGRLSSIARRVANDDLEAKINAWIEKEFGTND